MRQTYIVSRPGWQADPHSLDRLGSGIRIDWSQVSDDYLNADGKKEIPSGTPIGDTLGDGGSPRVAITNPAIGLLETTAVEGDLTAAKTGYGLVIGGVIYETLLPAALDEDTQNELQAAGTGFVFQTYFDSRAA